MESSRIRIPEDGFPLPMIVDLLGEEFDASDIREALDELVKRGEVYTTVDDNTFASHMAPVTWATAYSTTSVDPAWDDITKSIFTLYENFRPTIQGFTPHEMRTHLSVRYPADEIRRRCEALVNEGHLYSTIDEFHYARTTW